MKRITILLLALSLALTPVTCLAQVEYYTIQDLRQQTATGWTQTYDTKWRTVEVNAPILLPQVEAVPVVKLGYDFPSPEFAAEDSGGWDVTIRDGFALVLNKRNTKEVPRSVDVKRINKDPEQKGDWYGDFAPENTYVPMSDITYGEICDLIRAELTRFGYEQDQFDIESPFRIWSQHWYYYGYKEDALPGHIMLEAPQVLNGLPILTHVWEAVRNHRGEKRYDEYMERFQLSTGYDAYDEALGHLFITAAKPIEILADDVPLCSFDRVRSAIEPEIEAGRIRKVYELKLGYVLYNEPGLYRENRGDIVPYEILRYYAKPVWQVNCLYVPSATGELRKLPDDVFDERNTTDYYQLLIDAQTGELIQESSAKDRCEFRGFIFWEDVK